MLKSKDNLKSSGKIISIPNELISLNPYATRIESAQEDIYTLACSLRENGLIQPINVRPNGRTYQVIAGERRLRAARVAGIKSIPCIIMDISDEDMAIFAYCENYQRSKLSFYEEAEALNKIMGQFNYKVDEFAEKIGCQSKEITQKLNILKLPKDLRELSKENNLSEAQLLLLLKLKNNRQREDAIIRIAKEKLNEQQTELLIREMLYSTEDIANPSLKRIFKDIKIFENSIEKTIKVMNESGLNVPTIKTETDEFIEYIIKIPKAKSKIVREAKIDEDAKEQT